LKLLERKISLYLTMCLSNQQIVAYIHMRSLIISLFLLTVRAQDLATFGTVLSAGTGLLPPEMRGIAGTAANMALAKANLKNGIIEIIMDGSDYPWICLCATRTQLKQLNVGRAVPIMADECPDLAGKDPKVGCKVPQLLASVVPLPVAPTTAPPTTAVKK